MEALQTELAALKEKVYKKDGTLRSNARPEDIERIETMEKQIANTIDVPQKTMDDRSAAVETADAVSMDQSAVTVKTVGRSEQSEFADRLASLAEEVEMIKLLLRKNGLLRPGKFSATLKRQGIKAFPR